MAFYICPQCGADIDLSKGNTCEYCGFTVESSKETTEQVSVAADFLPPFMNMSEVSSSSVPSMQAEDDKPEVINEVSETFIPPVLAQQDVIQPVTTYSAHDIVDEISQIEEDADEKPQEIPPVSTLTAETSRQEIISNVPQQHLEPIPEKVNFHLGHHEEVEEIIEDIPSGMQNYQIEEDIIEDNEPIETVSEASIPSNIISQDSVENEISEIAPIASSDSTVLQPVQKTDVSVRVCAECGFENPPVAKFCLTCGNKLEEISVAPVVEEIEKNICPECSFENVPNARFCMSCGASLVKKEQEIPKEPVIAAQDLVSALNEVEQQVSLQEEPEVVDISPVITEKTEPEGILFKVKISYDNNNKFQYKFVFNKIKQINVGIDDNELKVLMSNSVFVIAVPPELFSSFQQELEDLDCKVEKIGEESALGMEEHEDVPTELHYYLSIKGMSSKTPEWKMKFVNMLTLMMPEMPQEEAERIVERDVEKILMENEHSAKELQKILSKLGCITQIIEMEEPILSTESLETIDENADGSSGEEDTIPEEDKQLIDDAMMVEAPGIAQEPVADNAADENPRFLILSGVDKKNWVVREKLAERISEIYPNMTSNIAREIVSQVVVRLRVKNLQEAEVLGKEFEEMGWNIRIDEVSVATGSTKKKSTLTKEELQRRKQTHQSFMKRQKSKHRNLVTAVVVFFVIATLGFLVWKWKFTEKYYVKVKNMDSLELIPTVEGPKVRLRAEPTKKSPYLQDMFLAETTRFELDTKEKIMKDGEAWYYVRYPSLRSRKAYVLADIMTRVDKDGNELPPNEQD